MPRIAALIVGAGSGSRMGAGRPKQYLALAGAPVIRRAIEAFDGIHFVMAVIGAGQEAEYAAATDGLYLLPPVIGGATRQESVRRGLEALAAHEPDFVLIHDAARPLVSDALIARVIAALESGARAAIPMIAAADTLRRQNDDGTWQSVPRENIFRAQTPQGFRFTSILKAHREHAEASLTDDMALAELAGMEIVVVAGEEANLKITTQDDMAHAARLLGGASETRTGLGFDAHRFAAGDHVMLCGVRIAHDRGLEGHSDADAGLHALSDALLACVSAGDIGQHFPPGDEKWKGAPSSLFLEHAASLVREAGGAILNCDVTLICERPKISPHRDAMRARIAEILNLDVSRISVKATTTEGMGFTGRAEGIAAEAIATIERPRT